MAQPAWQTDELAEEWIEEDDQPQLSSPTDDIAPTQHLPGSIKQGTIMDLPLDAEEDRRIGTFVVREDLPAAQVMPPTPGRAKKGGIRDFFSPLPLEKMFEPPSPPEQVESPSVQAPSLMPPTQQRYANRPVKPSKLSQVIGASFSETDEEREGEDEIVETDVPNMRGFRGLKPSPSCQFTFAIPQHSPRSKHAAEDIRFEDPTASGLPVAESTPLPPVQSHPLSHPPTDPRLRLFQFNYDTYTRDHLSAMVDSFGIESPSGHGSRSQSEVMAMINTPDRQDGIADDVNESFSRLRSTKRVKLSPPSQMDDGDRRHSPKKYYLGESKSLMEQIKRARDISMMSAATNVREDEVNDGEPLGKSVGHRRRPSSKGKLFQSSEFKRKFK